MVGNWIKKRGEREREKRGEKKRKKVIRQ